MRSGISINRGALAFRDAPQQEPGRCCCSSGKTLATSVDRGEDPLHDTLHKIMSAATSILFSTFRLPTRSETALDTRPVRGSSFYFCLKCLVLCVFQGQASSSWPISGAYLVRWHVLYTVDCKYSKQRVGIIVVQMSVLSTIEVCTR